MSGDYFDEIVDPDDFEPEEKDDLNLLIDGWLADARPERYELGDKTWQDAIVDKAADELESMPHDETIRDAARRRVYRREQEATRKANSFLREIYMAEGLPLEWGDGAEGWKLLRAGVLRMPLSIGKRRVRLGACTTADLDEWVLARRDQQAKEETTREQTIEGALLVRKWISEQGARRFEDLHR